MATLYRHDLGKEDFQRLAVFKGCLWKLFRAGQIKITELETGKFAFPRWYESGLGWRFSALREVEKPCIGIPKKDMHKLCRYMKINPKELFVLLYRFGLLAVTTGDEEPKKYRFDLAGQEFYILEKRRLIKTKTETKPPLRIAPNH